MKIAGNIPNIYQSYKNEKSSKVEKSSEFGELLKGKEAVLKDKVEISGAAVKMQNINGTEIEFLKRKFMLMDGNREVKLEKLKENIKNGKYEVSDEEIVEAILNKGEEMI
jgi:anti-sigma28 factor (negative regulator of flagellin synthesis)